jgi:hypothetical protein
MADLRSIPRNSRECDISNAPRVHHKAATRFPFSVVHARRASIPTNPRPTPSISAHADVPLLTRQLRAKDAH